MLIAFSLLVFAGAKNRTLHADFVQMPEGMNSPRQPAERIALPIVSCTIPAVCALKGSCGSPHHPVCLFKSL